MIYAGLAGDARERSGNRSANTLWLRISGMHLRNNNSFSTLRHTLGSVLCEAQVVKETEQEGLTRWMDAHW